MRRYRYIYKGNKDGLESQIGKFKKNKDGSFSLRGKQSAEIIEKVSTLRQLGKSYNEISNELGIPKSTLSYWLSGPSDAAIKSANKEKNREASKRRLFEFGKARKQRLFVSYDEALHEAAKSYETYKNQPMFIAGLMIYAGEGDKATRGHIRVSNADWRIHEKFLQFIEKYLDFTRDKVSLQLLSYPDNDQKILKEYWLKKLSISNEKLHKIQVLKSKSSKRLQFGVAMTIINSTRSKYILMEWINLCLDGK